MAKPLKIFLWIVGGFIALVAIAAIALPLILNPNNYKDDAARVTKDKTGRELRINGDIKLSLFPWLGANVRDVTLANAQGFGPEPFAQVAEMDVGVRLMPLLFDQRVEVSKVRVDGVAVNLARNADGTNNWSDLASDDEAKTETPEQDTPAGERKPLEFSVGGVEVRNAAFSYTDKQSGAAYKVANLGVETGPIKPGDPLDVKIEFIVNSAQPQLESDVKIAFTALTNVQPGVHEIKDLKIDTSSKGPAVPGGSQKANMRGNVKYDGNQGTFAFSDGKLEAAGLQLTAAVQGTGLNADAPKLSGKLATNTFNPKNLAASFGAALPPTTDPKALTQASFAASIAGDPANARLENLTLKLDQTTATGGMTISNFADPKIDFALKADTFDADRYLPPPAPEQKNAPKDQAGDFRKEQIPIDALDLINAKGTIELGALKLKNLSFTQIKITLDAKKGQAKTQQMDALLYGGRITQSARLTRNSPWTYDMKVGLASINSQPLLKDLVGKSFLSGLGDLNLNVTSTGDTYGAFLQALDGNVGASFQKGALEGFNLSQTIDSAKAMLRGEPMAASDEPKRTEFRDLKAGGKIVDGVLDTDTFNVSGTWYQLGGDGKLNLVEQTIDYTLLPKFTSDKHKDLAGLKVPITVAGSWYAPKIRVDLKGAAKGAVKEELKQQEEKVKEKAKSKLDDFLKKKLGPKPAPAPAPTEPAPAPSEQPKTETQPAPAPSEEPKTETPPPEGA
jgi:AsmA protein